MLRIVIVMVPGIGGIGTSVDDVRFVAKVRFVAAYFLPTKGIVAGNTMKTNVMRDNRITIERKADDVIMLIRTIRHFENTGRRKVKVIISLAAGMAVAVIKNAVDIRVSLRVRMQSLVWPVDW